MRVANGECDAESLSFSVLLEPEKGKRFTLGVVQANLPLNKENRNNDKKYNCLLEINKPLLIYFFLIVLIYEIEKKNNMTNLIKKMQNTSI